jgi:NAD+ dependent glucose-6-phosphate dehydrogenase
MEPFVRAGIGDRTTLRDALGPHEEVVEFDCADYDAFLAACKGVHTVIHLAADPSPSADFYGSLLQRNIIGESMSSPVMRSAWTMRRSAAISAERALAVCVDVSIAISYVQCV